MKYLEFPAAGDYTVDGVAVTLTHTSERHAQVIVDAGPIGAIAAVAATETVEQYFIGRLLLEQHGSTPTFRSSSWVGLIRAMVIDAVRQKPKLGTQ